MKYEVIDNFLSLNDLNYLNSIIMTLEPKSDSPTSFRSRVSYEPNKNTLPQEKLMDLYRAYLPRAMDILQLLAPHKRDLVDDAAFNLQSTPPGYHYPVHLDASEKVLSGVVYLQPEMSTGTFLHKDPEDRSGFEVPWAVNRAFFFSRSPSDSWHSYKGDGVGYRWVLVFNLLTSKPRKHEIRDLGLIGYTMHRMTKRLGRGVENTNSMS